MKLKTLLTIILYDCKSHFYIQDPNNDYEVSHEFIARCDSEVLKQYEEYWVTFIDMEENKIFLTKE